jgi:hypothetical protein
MAGSIDKFVPAALQVYFKQTRSHFFGLLSILLLLVIYEVSSAKLYADQQIQIRNSAEIMIKRLFWFMGIRNSVLLWLIYFALLAWAFWLAKKAATARFQIRLHPLQYFREHIICAGFGLDRRTAHRAHESHAGAAG